MSERSSCISCIMSLHYAQFQLRHATSEKHAFYQGLGFFATVIGVFRYGGDISDCNGGFLQRC